MDTLLNEILLQSLNTKFQVPSANKKRSKNAILCTYLTLSTSALSGIYACNISSHLCTWSNLWAMYLCTMSWASYAGGKKYKFTGVSLCNRFMYRIKSTEWVGTGIQTTFYQTFLRYPLRFMQINEPIKFNSMHFLMYSN